jgi:hypothetical protein
VYYIKERAVSSLINLIKEKMRKEIKNKNLVARITESHNKFNVKVLQISNTGLQVVEDLVKLKTGISTFNRAEKFALKQVA